MYAIIESYSFLTYDNVSTLRALKKDGTIVDIIDINFKEKIDFFTYNNGYLYLQIFE